MDLVVWNGFAGKLQVYRGPEEQAANQADSYTEVPPPPGVSVIYFYATIDTITLKEN